jgi:hydrogenase maturation protease
VNKPTILVAAVGNIFLGDDGFGSEVARRLSGVHLPDDVRVVDFGIRSFDLAFALLDNPSLTILVDATHLGGVPGTLYTMDPTQEDFVCKEERFIDGHRLDLVQVLRLTLQMGGRLGRILLVGCEPETFGPEEGLMGLSATVAAAVDQAVAIVGSLVAQAGTETTALAHSASA